jgi:hypothetical protein
MCGRSKDEVALEVDHVLAVAEGGTDEMGNLATLCRDCNGGKSAYRFADYRNVSVVPDSVEALFHFSIDGRTGDFQRYWLFLYFSDPASGSGKFEHWWKIPGTQLDTSPDLRALEQRRRREEEEKFVKEIKCKLIAEGRRLVLDESGLRRVDG